MRKANWIVLAAVLCLVVILPLFQNCGGNGTTLQPTEPLDGSPNMGDLPLRDGQVNVLDLDLWKAGL